MPKRLRLVPLFSCLCFVGLCLMCERCLMTKLRHSHRRVTLAGANDFMKKITHKTGRAVAVACSVLLGRRRMGTKSCDNRLRLLLGAVNNGESELGKMKPYPSVIAVVIDALKKKGMRFKEVSLTNG